MDKVGKPIAIIAPSFPFFHDKLRANIKKLEERGHTFVFTKHLFDQSFIFSGTDESRAKDFWKWATHPKVGTLWCARGGYGATRILPILDEFTKRYGKPERKTLAGYSDITALLDYVRSRWGWDALHAPMPGVGEFEKLSASHVKDLELCLKGVSHKMAVEKAELTLIPGLSKRGSTKICGKMAGGNLTVICSMIGTPYEMKTHGKILFIEDTGEPIYRLDRMFNQLLQSGAVDKAEAIVMGTFSDCEDRVAKGLRPKVKKAEAMSTIFKWLASQTKTPIFTGLPVGHSEPGGKSPYGLSPLWIGREYAIERTGSHSRKLCLL